MTFRVTVAPGGWRHSRPLRVGEEPGIGFYHLESDNEVRVRSLSLVRQLDLSLYPGPAVLDPPYLGVHVRERDQGPGVAAAEGLCTRGRGTLTRSEGVRR